MRKIFISTLIASSLLGTSLFAKDDTPLKITSKQTTKEVSKKAVRDAQADAQNSQVKLVKEAIDSLHLTAKTLADLDKNDIKSAKSDLEKALGKLEVILSAKNAPKLLPIESSVKSVDFIGTKDDIKSTIKSVQKLLKENKVQDARVLLNTLQSEIDVTVVSLPLATYPDALKLAASYIHDGKIEKAKGVLEIALSTFDSVTHIIPLPLIKATDLIAVSQLLAKDGKKDEAIKYLSVAQEQLDIAKELGYVSKSDTTYESLAKEIKEIQKEIKGKNEAQKLFDKLKKNLKDFKEKIFSSKEKD